MERLRVTSQEAVHRGAGQPLQLWSDTERGTLREARVRVPESELELGKWGLGAQAGVGEAAGKQLCCPPCWPGLHPQRPQSSSWSARPMLALSSWACCCHCVHRGRVKSKRGHTTYSFTNLPEF